jgi:hypothetical protein
MGASEGSANTSAQQSRIFLTMQDTNNPNTVRNYSDSEIQDIVNAYHLKKRDAMAAVREVEKLFDEGRIFLWSRDLRIHQILGNLGMTEEARRFTALDADIKSDAHLEKRFRAQCLNTFLRMRVDPDDVDTRNDEG